MTDPHDGTQMDLSECMPRMALREAWGAGPSLGELVLRMCAGLWLGCLASTLLGLLLLWTVRGY